MSYIGDVPLGNTFDTKFCTVQSTGAPTTLSASPVISCYVGNSTTELTAGITLTVDFDSRTGLNNVRVVATSGNGYATATDNQLVITTGTVNSVSAVGYVVAEFSIENRSALRPTTIGRTLDVASTGEAGLDFANINSYAAGAFAPTAIVDSGTAQAATSTTLQLRSAAAFADSELVGATIVIRSATAGAGQRRLITAYTGSTDTATVDAWTTTPTGTIVYDVFGSAPGSASTPAPVNMTQILGTAVATPNTPGLLDVNAKQVNGVSTSSVTAVNANVGTTQPLNFTGTSSSALVKSDVVDIAGAAVSTTTAQLGANIVKIANTTVNGNGAGTPWGP